MAPTMQAPPPIKAPPEQGGSTRRPETGASGSSMYTHGKILKFYPENISDILRLKPLERYISSNEKYNLKNVCVRRESYICFLLT